MLNETAQLFDFEAEAASRASPGADLRAGPDRDVVTAMLGATKDAYRLAGELLRTYRDLPHLMAADRHVLAQVPGMTSAAVATLHACQVGAERVARHEFKRKSVITSWTALLAYARTSIAGCATEQFRVMFLDKKNCLIADEVMGTGTVDHAPVYPREVARRALLLDASAIILCHNHPSGDPTPSTADVEMTRQCVDALRPLRITVHDHIVVGSDGVASLKALGLF